MLNSDADEAIPTVPVELIEDASERLQGLVVRTPLLESEQLNDVLGLRVLFKPECLQRTGSFKFRGAYTKLSRLPVDRRAAGVIAYSSGNHAQGVAAAARLLDIPATIFMPQDAPAIKINNTRDLGAEVVFFDRNRDDRQALAEQRASETGATVVPPFDDVDIISGQGTIGLEIAQQADYLNISVDDLLCPAGGGGLMSGISVAIKSRSPLTRLWFAEPEHYDDMRLSLEAGHAVAITPGRPTLCDAIATPRPGDITFQIINQTASGGFVVSDNEIVDAMALLFDRLKVVVEPGGSAAMAALLRERTRFAGKTVVVVASGGNVDRDVFGKALAQARPLGRIT